MGNKWCASCKSQSQLSQKPSETGNPPEGQSERTGRRAEPRDEGETQPVAVATTLTISANERKLVAESEIQQEPYDEKGHNIIVKRIDFSSVPGSVLASSAAEPRIIKEDGNTEEEEEEEEEEKEEEEKEREADFKRTLGLLPPLPHKVEAERKERDRWQDIISDDIERKARYIVDINLFIAAKVLYPALESFRMEQIETRYNDEGREQLMR